MLEPFRERRAYYENHKSKVKDIIVSGTGRANAIGVDTMRRVNDAMKISI